MIAHRQLGDEYSAVLLTPKKEVTKGLYKYIKHPMYLGNMVLILGASLIHPVFGIMVVAWAFYYSRMVVEDMLLRRKQ